jgi:hypothetical protein
MHQHMVSVKPSYHWLCVSKYSGLGMQRQPNQRVEPTDTERWRLRAGLGASEVVGEGVLVAPYRRLTRKPLGAAEWTLSWQ